MHTSMLYTSYYPYTLVSRYINRDAMYVHIYSASIKAFNQSLYVLQPHTCKSGALKMLIQLKQAMQKSPGLLGMHTAQYI